MQPGGRINYEYNIVYIWLLLQKFEYFKKQAE